MVKCKYIYLFESKFISYTSRNGICMILGELHSSIQRLEVVIFGQMQQLWQSLDALRAQLVSDHSVKYPDRRSVVFQFKPDMG